MVSSYQSASGAGAAAMAELEQQYKDILETGKTEHINKFPRLNLITTAILTMGPITMV